MWDVIAMRLRVSLAGRCASLTSSIIATALTVSTAVAGAASPAAKDAVVCDAPNDVFLNPFNSRSAHHRPIGSGAVYAGTNDQTTQSWLRARGSWRINSDNGWGRNVFQVTYDDPRTMVTWNRDFSGKGLPKELRVTPGASNGRVSDSIIIVVQPTGIADEFYRWWPNESGPTASIRRRWQAHNLGHGSWAWDLVGVTAGGQAGLFGLLRGFEINTPGHRIEHVLTSAIPPTLLSATGAFQWPATGADGCSQQKRSCTSGTIPYGALFAVPPVEQGGPGLTTLGLSEAGLRLAQTLRDYGTYIQDKGGNLTIPADQYVSSSLIATLNRDLNTVQPYLRMVTNNAQDQDVSGGGTPRAPNCAYDAQ